MLRAVRKWLTAQVTEAAVRATPHLSVATVDRLTAQLADLARHLPVLARQVADNMKTLGVYTPAAHRDYFGRLGAHFAGALHALRYAEQTTGDSMCPALADLVHERIQLDDSTELLRDAVGAGRGVIVMGPHITNYLLFLARLNEEVPLTVYLRHSKDTRRTALKERWYRASAVRWIAEPPGQSGPLGRLGRMATALGAGRVLFITPDLPQKRDAGTPVRFFGREIYLPAGPALLAVRSGAPLFMLLARPGASAALPQQLTLHGPYDGGPSGAGRVARREAVRRRLQWFATCLEDFLRQHPALWHLWGDKRWTRVLHNDARYVRPLRPRPTSAGAPHLAGVS